MRSVQAGTRRFSLVSYSQAFLEPLSNWPHALHTVIRRHGTQPSGDKAPQDRFYSSLVPATGHGAASQRVMGGHPGEGWVEHLHHCAARRCSHCIHNGSARSVTASLTRVPLATN